jgi:hypothetical protein
MLVVEHRNTALHLSVAVCAEQGALGGLRLKLGKGASTSAPRQREGFGRWIEMVKLQRSEMPSIAADLASTASLFDEALLCSPAPSRDVGPTTLHAPVGAAIL